MGKTKKTVSSETVRKSARLALKPQPAPVEKKKAVAKKGPKAKRGKAAESENAKAEDTKAETTEAN